MILSLRLNVSPEMKIGPNENSDNVNVNNVQQRNNHINDIQELENHLNDAHQGNINVDTVQSDPYSNVPSSTVILCC